MNVVCTLVIVVGYVRAKSPATTEAYLDSFTIQDSCQFSLCGPEYSQEFLLGNKLLLKAKSKDDVRMVMKAAVKVVLNHIRLMPMPCNVFLLILV